MSCCQVNSCRIKPGNSCSFRNKKRLRVNAASFFSASLVDKSNSIKPLFKTERNADFGVQAWSAASPASLQMQPRTYKLLLIRNPVLKISASTGCCADYPDCNYSAGELSLAGIFTQMVMRTPHPASKETILLISRSSSTCSLDSNKKLS